MPDWLVIGLPFVALFGLLAVGVPVAFSLGLSGGLGVLLVRSVESATGTMGSVPLSVTASFELTAIPLFMLMGLVVSHSGMLDNLFLVAQRLTRRIPGGLAISAVGGATIFGGISGSSAADAATIGRISIAQMSARGYAKPYAAAVVASAATVDILIPPSIVLVVFGIVTSESVGALLLAGIIPGLLTALVYAIVIYLLARSGRPGTGGVTTVPPAAVLSPSAGAARVEAWAPSGATGLSGVATSTGAASEPKPASRVEIAFGLVGSVVIFLVVVGGIYSGWVTATESAAVGAAVSVLLSVLFMLLFRKNSPSGRIGRALRASLSEGASLTAMVLMLVVGASIFSQFLILARIPTSISRAVAGWDVWPPLVVIMFLLILLPIGMFIDGLSMMLIVAPLAYPIVTELGFDGIWFAILFVKMIEIALLTPPVGLNVYVVAGLFPDLSAESIFRRIVPFVAAEFVVVAILFAFPAITTWLPSIASVRG